MAQTIFNVLILFMLCILAGCSKNSGTEEITKALEDRLTDALNFEGGLVMGGESPEGDSSEISPQIIEIDAPAKLHPAIPFVVRLTTNFDKPDLVNQAIVRVVGATKHLLVMASLREGNNGWVMSLSGLLDEDLHLAGESFTLEYALQTKDGLTGGYKGRDLAIPEKGIEPDCESGLCCNGGEWIEEGVDCVEGDAYACTEDTCTANHACESMLAAGKCLIEETCYATDDFNPDNECQACQPNETKDSWTALADGAPCDNGVRVCVNGTCITLDDGDVDLDPEQEQEPEVDGDVDLDSESEPEAEIDVELVIGTFVPIVAGSFWMGSPDGSCPVGYPGNCSEAEPGRDLDAEELHEVTLTYNFELQAHEVTEAEFEELMGWNPMDTYDSDCNYGCGDRHPVTFVSWYDILAYANQLSLDADLAPCYMFSNVECEDSSMQDNNYMACMNGTQQGIEAATVTLAGGATKPQDCESYRSPTEAEWEYSIRAGSYSAFYPSEGNDGSYSDNNLSQIGWYSVNNTPQGTKPVGGKEPNVWGLYDMSGNVHEWVWDSYQDDYQTDVATDPVGPASDMLSVRRGGYWDNDIEYCRSASRSNFSSGNRSEKIGFRLAKSRL